ncbi:MAG TPA: MBL fold metallo-hydrolase [Candidatus Acidoferrum sp.]|nr:MBL fold metallo-hydrolase [Candidatus Acidoferrum sp.]
MRLTRLIFLLPIPALFGAATALAQTSASTPAANAPAELHNLKVTILSTMLADDGIGEWGFAALVEADGRKILYDTGARPNTVLENAHELKIDLSVVQDVILSHFHADHTTGLITLRRELSYTNPAALSRVHVSQGIFLSRRQGSDETEQNPMIAIKKEYEATGGKFIVHEKPYELLPGVWLTGPVPRAYPEKN